jgi:CheY-like chemotaxis protein
VKKKVLVVDDNANNLTLEKDLLEVAGFEVLEAENATDGIRMAREDKPDVIVLDVRLPDMLGTEAAVILRGEDATAGIPIVFVTASVIGEGIAEMKLIENSGFISKPINTRTFAKDVGSFCGPSP